MSPEDASWEDAVLGGIDRFLTAAMSTSRPSETPSEKPTRRPSGRTGKRPSPPGKTRPPGPKKSLTSWKKATAAEGLGVLLILVFVVIARPDPNEMQQAGAAPDYVEAVAAGADAEGVIVLTSGVRVHMLGVSMPTPDDPTAVRVASIRSLNRLMHNRPVVLEYDPVLSSRAQEGRPTQVAYVWVRGADGGRKGMANAMLLSRGLVRPVTDVGYRRLSQFVQAARLAQGRGAGVWAAPPPGQMPLAFR